jgi:hypothetical protein
VKEDESEHALIKEKLKALREENISFNKEIVHLTAENENLEKNLVEAKMNWAELDMENDQLAFKLK